MHRFRFFLLTATTATLASTAYALPQASTGGARTTVRTRCVNCPTARDSSFRARQERLLLKLDSLRWEIDNVHLTETERARVEREMTRTIVALESAFGETMAGEAAPARVTVGFGATRAAVAGTGRAGPTAVIAVEALQPQGYLGATFDGPHIKFMRDNELHVRFYQYPKIAMVEESSPAGRAGILEGDTVLALGGTDVKNEISLTKLLVPNARIVVRVRREGDAKDLHVTVREAPNYYVMRAAPLPARAPRSPFPVMPQEQVRVPGEPMPPMVVTPTPRAGGTTWIFNNGVAGAQVATVSDGLGKAVGVKEGVLVIRAEPGTPAFRSGLRDGDVILRADGRTVATVNALRQAVAEGSGDEGVKLRILREKKQRDVTLRW